MPFTAFVDIREQFSKSQQHLTNEQPLSAIVDEIYSILTAWTIESIGALSRVHGGRVQPLPRASVNRMSCSLETLAAPPYDGRANLAEFARSHSLEIDDLFPTAEALHILEFAELDGGALKLTAAGHVFVQSGTDERKRLFREHLLRFVPAWS